MTSPPETSPADRPSRAGSAPRRAYLVGAAGVAAATAASAVAGFASLWLLTRILPKEMFGGYAFTMAVLGLLAGVATLGLDRSLLLRIARRAVRPGTLRGAGLIRRILVLSQIVAAGFAILMAVLAGPLVEAGMLAEARFWFPAMAAALLPLSASMILQAWYQSNHQVGTASVMPGVSDLARCCLLGLVLVLGLGAAGVAAAAVLAAVVPVAYLALRARGRSLKAPSLLGRSDLLKGGQFLTMRLANQGMQQIDMILIGLLLGGAATAEYAVAVRLAIFADYGTKALKPTFTPRIRAAIAARADTARAEFLRIRDAAFALGLAAAIGLAVLGQPLLALFGGYGGAWPLLMIVAAGHTVNAGFGMHVSYLAMHGEVGWSSILRVAGLALLTGLALWLVPVFGPVGAAVAMLATQLAMNVAGAGLAWRLTGLVSIDAAQGILLAVAVAALMAGAAAYLPPMAVAAALSAVIAALTWRNGGWRAISGRGDAGAART